MEDANSLTDLLLKTASGVADTKELLEAWSQISPETWHVLIGVLIQLAVAALVRRGIGSFIPWGVVLALELANEINDIFFRYWEVRPYAVAENAMDAVLTMILPTLLFILARAKPRIFGLTRSAATNSDEDQDVSTND